MLSGEYIPAELSDTEPESDDEREEMGGEEEEEEEDESLEDSYLDAPQSNKMSDNQEMADDSAGEPATKTTSRAEGIIIVLICS